MSGELVLDIRSSASIGGVLSTSLGRFATLEVVVVALALPLEAFPGLELVLAIGMPTSLIGRGRLLVDVLGERLRVDSSPASSWVDDWPPVFFR